MRKLTLFSMIVCFCLLASNANAQFNMFFAYAAPGAPLVTACDGATPLPDGRLVKIFQDIDNDGPDLTDPQPVICSDPPDCITPFDAVNLNQFLTNGISEGFGAGYFTTTETMSCNATLPANPHYYLRIYEADQLTVLWTSTVTTATFGYQEVIFEESDWTCGAMGPQCTVIDETE